MRMWMRTRFFKSEAPSVSRIHIPGLMRVLINSPVFVQAGDSFERSHFGILSARCHKPLFFVQSVSLPAESLGTHSFAPSSKTPFGAQVLDTGALLPKQ